MDQVTYNEYVSELNEESKKKLLAFDPPERVKWVKYIYEAQKKRDIEQQAKTQKLAGLTLLATAVFFVGLVSFVWSLDDGDERKPCLYWNDGYAEQNITKQDVFERLCDNAGRPQFSFWDGSNYQIVEWTKRQLNNPDSFEHVATSASDLTGDAHYITIKMSFKAENEFGGLELKDVIGKVHKRTGNVKQANIR